LPLAGVEQFAEKPIGRRSVGGVRWTPQAGQDQPRPRERVLHLLHRTVQASTGTLIPPGVRRRGTGQVGGPDIRHRQVKARQQPEHVKGVA